MFSNMTSDSPHALRLYLAGPEVFLPDAIATGRRYKNYAARRGFSAIFPMDNDVPGDATYPDAFIFRANRDAIIAADVVVANLNPFRGAEPDSGAVWEAAFAIGMGKFVVGYLSSSAPLIERVRALDGLAPTAVVDCNGASIEDFGLPLNLMLAHGLSALVTGAFEDAIDWLVANRVNLIARCSNNSF